MLIQAREIPIDPSMVSLWVPAGNSLARDLIRGNHGQCYGTHPNVPVLPSLINPSVGWHFDKVDDRIVVPNDKSLDLTDEITAIAWIYPRTLGEGNYGRIFDKSSANAFSFLLYDNNSLRFTNVGLSENAPINSITLNEWNFVGFNYHGTNRNGKFYVNGQDVGNIGDLGAMGTSVQDLFIGNEIGLTRTFDGYIALVALANKAWSQQQINNFYLQTRGLFAPRG